MTDVVERDPAASLLGFLAELRSYTDEWYEGPVPDRAIRLDRLLAVQAHLAEIKANLQQDLADSMDEDQVVTPVGVLRRVPVTREVWRYKGANERMREDLAVAVAVDIALDNATGEIDPLKRNVALAALRAAYDAIPSFSTIKVAGRKRFRMHLADYRTSETHYTVEIGEPDDA